MPDLHALSAVRLSRQVLCRLVGELAARHPSGTHLTGVEVGVACGNTSVLLLREFPMLTLIMVDSWTSHAPDSPYARTGDRRARLSEADQLRRMKAAEKAVDFARSRAFIWRATSVEAAAVVGEYDFVFLDASHSLVETKADLYAWFGCVRNGGLLVGHDYSIGGRWPGVRRAVDRFCKRKNLTLQTDESSIWWAWKE